MPETFDYSREEFDIKGKFILCHECHGWPGQLPDGTHYHDHECIKCGEEDKTLAADNFGYCGHCHWAVKAEVQEGFYDIEEFLLRHAEFMKWCLENDRMI